MSPHSQGERGPGGPTRDYGRQSMASGPDRFSSVPCLGVIMHCGRPACPADPARPRGNAWPEASVLVRAARAEDRIRARDGPHGSTAIDKPEPAGRAATAKPSPP